MQKVINQKKKKKKLKDEIYLIIRNDIPLRDKIGKALNIERESVYISAIRKAIKFDIPSVLEIISKHTGISKDELLAEDQDQLDSNV